MFELLLLFVFLFVGLGILFWLIKLIVKAILYISGTVVFLILLLAFFPVLLVIFIVGFKVLLLFFLLIPVFIAGLVLKFLIAPFI